jgi:hypothetical protein
MSGVNAQIPLSFQPTPNVGPNFGKAISDANNLVQLQQFKQQVERANKLRDILGAPDAIDPATGAPKPDTLSRVMGVDPAAGMKLQQNTLEMQQHKLQMDRYKTDTFAKQYELTKDVSNEAYTAYKQALADGKDEQAARAIGQQAQTEGQERLAKGGGFSEEQQKSWPRQFDPVQAAGHVQTYQQWETERDKEKQRGIEEERIKRQEKRDEDTNRRAGAAIGKDSKGRLIFAFPNAEPGKRLQYGDGSSVPPEEEGGFTKVGTGAGAQKDADNAAIEAGIRKDHSDWGENQVKLERMRQVAGATNKTLQDPTKGWEILTDAEGNDYQHRKGTGESLDMNGEPYAPKGHSTKLAGPRAPSAANQDRDAVTNVVRSDYEKELGRPVNLADPNEKAELDRRTLAAEDKRAADRAGATTGARVAAQQAAGKPMPVTVNGVRQDALFHDGHYFNLDGTPMEGKVLGVTRAEGSKTPGQAAEEDAMSIADKRIAAMETQRGTPLDQAERAEQRQIARADPKIQETARKQDANAIDDDSAKLIAEESLRGDWHGTVGMGRNQASMRKIAEWRGKLAKEQGLSGADLAANTAEFMGILAAERVLGTRGAGIDLGIAEAGKFAPMVLRASDMVDRTKFPTVNSLLLAAEKGTGGEAVIRLIDSLNAYKMAYTQILTRGGMPTDDSRRRADEVIDKAWSNGQIKTALDQLNQEMNGARSAVPEVRDNLYKALTGKSRTSPVDQVPSPVDRAHQSQPTQGQGAISPELQQGIDILKKRPETAAAFEKHFNLPAGSAQQYLKVAPAAPAAAQPTPALTQQTPAPAQQPTGTPAPTQPTTPTPREAAKPNIETMQSATGTGGKKIYWDGQAWINPDGTPYKP